MTVRYVGSGGSDAAAGTSWATRKLTLNGVEDTPVVAGDIVYVAPGVYREQLTVDVNGSAGNPITYVADVTGEHTDGIGGYVRLTGANALDSSSSRAQCVYASAARSYRTFRGLWVDTPLAYHLYFAAGADNLVLEDCAFTDGPTSGDTIELIGSVTNCTIRRCTFMGEQGKHIVFYNTGTAVFSSGNRVENCVFVGGAAACVYMQGIYEVTVANNAFLSFGRGIHANSTSAGHTQYVYQNIFSHGGESIRGLVVGDITEDCNRFHGNLGDLFNTTDGVFSDYNPPLWNPLMLLSGFMLPQHEPWSLSRYSRLRTTLESETAALRVSGDLYGLGRTPHAEDTENQSLGPVQFRNATRTTLALGGVPPKSGTAMLQLIAGGQFPIRRVPVSAVSTTIALWLRYGSQYHEGGPFANPRMIIRQPGQADRYTSMVGADSTWAQVTDTFTPAALPPYVDVLVESFAVGSFSSGYGVYVDAMTVT